jgi:hypothetical protein
VAELEDGSWLLAGSWYPGALAAALTGAEGEMLEFYRSPDRGRTWEFYSTLKAPYPHSLSEASILILPDGRYLLYSRENGIYPGVKAFSKDKGRTWDVEELPFCITGRTCAGFLRDGRVLLTFRSQIGRPSLWAWVGDPEDKTRFGFAGAHFNDSRSVGLNDGALHIDNDGRSGQFTMYSLRPPDRPESPVEVAVRVKVEANSGHAATLSIPYVGRVRLFPDRVELAHDPSVVVKLKSGGFHTYRVVSRDGRMKLFIDGGLEVDTGNIDNRSSRLPWTPVRASIHAFAFGNEDPRASVGPAIYPSQITPQVSGHSIWTSVEAVVDESGTCRRVTTSRRPWGKDAYWSPRNGFPDQYQLNNIIEVDASVFGTDQGYSGWVELEDGRIFVASYTDDASGPDVSGLFHGVSWIRGTYLDPCDLPVRHERY